MDIFSDSSETRDETINVIRKYINCEISNASSKGEFSVVYNEHPYETLDTLGIIKELENKGYSIHPVMHPYSSKLHRAFISW